MKLRLRSKMLMSILGTVAIIYLGTVGYVGYKTHELSMKNAMQLADTYVGEYAATTKANLDVDMDIARTLVQAFSNYSYDKGSDYLSIYTEMQRKVLEQNPTFISVWSSWELSALDSTYKVNFGRVRYAFYRSENQIAMQHDTVDVEGDKIGSAYYKIKTSRKETVIDPYYYTYTDGNSFYKLLETTVAVPLIENETFKAIVGIDLSLDRFQKQLGKIHPWPNSYAFLISNNGSFIYHPIKEYINKTFNKTFPEIDNMYGVSERILNGEAYSFDYETDNVEYYVSFAPVFVGKSSTPWALGIVTPIDEINTDARKMMMFIVLIVLIGLSILTFIVMYLANYITSPINQVSRVLQNIAIGRIDFNKKIEAVSSDELGDIQIAVNSLIEGLEQTIGFAEEIGKGNLNSEYSVKSSEDVLGSALVQMRLSLHKAKEEEGLRKVIEERINWATVGHNKVSDTLRMFNTNLEELSYNVISFLVQYLDANQGGIFIIDDDEENQRKQMVLSGAYAYDHKRLINKTIQFGDGLIGRCVQEKEVVFLKEIPEGYLEVTSGIGQRTPNNLIIVPLIFNDEVYGAIEVASFKNFEEYQIRFLEEAAASIGSTISIVKINMQRAQLFEETELKSKELSSQEEEMRQNFEEMMVAREDVEKRVNEYKSLLDAIKSATFVAEYDLEGRLTDINEPMLRFVNMSKNQLIGRYQGTFEASREKNDASFDEFWRRLRNGETMRKVQHIRLSNKDYFLSEVYTPIYNENNEVYKVLNVSVDISKHISDAESEKIKQ